MKKFCELLGEQAKSIIDFEMKKMLPLTRKKLKSFKDTDVYLRNKILKQSL